MFGYDRWVLGALAEEDGMGRVGGGDGMCMASRGG